MWKILIQISHFQRRQIDNTVFILFIDLRFEKPFSKHVDSRSDVYSICRVET